MKVEVFYDTLCSWCRVAKINFKHAVEKLTAEGKIDPKNLEIIYRSYVIYPEIPDCGLDYQQMIIDDDDLDAIDPKHDTPIHRWGKRAGMDFFFERIKIKPNTYLGHQFLHMIDQKYFEALLADIQYEYFVTGGNINDINFIAQLATKYIGAAKAEEIKNRALAGERKDEVDADIQIAEDYNVDLLPMYVFDGKVRLEGGILQKKFEDALLGKLEPNIN